MNSLRATTLIGVMLVAGIGNACAADQVERIENLTLKKCYELALIRSEEIAIQKENVAETYAQFLKAAGDAFGNLDFVIQNTRQEIQKSDSGSSIGSTFTAASRRERKWTFEQPIFRGFKAFGALSGAGSLRGEQKELYERAKELLFQDVTEAFFGLLEANRDLVIIESTKSLFVERIADLKERESIGRSRGSEVINATSRKNVIDANLAQANGSARTASFLLEYLIGVPIDANQLVDEEVLETIQQDLSHYLMAAKTRSDLRAQEQAVKTSWRNIIIAQSALWPQFTMEGNSYEKREGFQSGIDWDLLFKITVPVATGGTTAGEIKEAYSEWKKEKLTKSQINREIDYEVKTAFQNWISSNERRKALRDAVLNSEENYKLQKDEYSRNLVSNLEVLEALESLNDTKRESNQADYETKINYYKLQVTAGEIKV